MRTFAHQLFGIGHVLPQAEPPCVELQSCDFFSHESIFVNPKSMYKCIDTLGSTLTCLLMPYKDLRAPTFWNRSCPAPSQASMCGTSVLWLFQSWNNLWKSKKYVQMHWHPWKHPNVFVNALQGPSRTKIFGIGHVPPQPEPQCVELQSCDSFSQETIIANPKKYIKMHWHPWKHPNVC